MDNVGPAQDGSDLRLQRSLPWGIKESSLRSAFWGTPRVVGRPVCGCWDRHYTLKVSNWIPVLDPALLWPEDQQLEPSLGSCSAVATLW